MALSLLVLLQIKPRVDGLPDSAVRLLRRERVLDLREVERELIGRDVATAAALVRAHEHVGERDLVELDPWPVPAQSVCVLPSEVAAAGAGVFPGATDDRVIALASAADADTDDRSAGQRERVDLERACAFAGDVERRVDADVLGEELTHRVTLAVDELAVDRVALALGRKLSVLRVDVPSTAEKSHRRRARRRWTSRA